jgi:hypothetical protein
VRRTRQEMDMHMLTTFLLYRSSTACPCVDHISSLKPVLPNFQQSIVMGAFNVLVLKYSQLICISLLGELKHFADGGDNAEMQFDLSHSFMILR